jgi:putative hemolysin
MELITCDIPKDEQQKDDQTGELAQDLTIEWLHGASDLHPILDLRKICFPGVREVLREADLSARHLVVRNSAGQVCGAYRVSLSSDMKRFESEEDFVLTPFLKIDGVKAELAWACVHPDFRDGRVIHLLWRGLADFFKAHNVRYVFGLASIPSVGQKVLKDILAYLNDQNFVMTSDQVKAKRPYFGVGYFILERGEARRGRRLLPSLLRAYIMAGALVCAQPVFDADLDCFDFMTVLDMDGANTSMMAHFNL